MTDDLMKYDQMVEDALRGVVRKALQHALEEGLPGDHHFYLTFRTTAPGASIPDYLQDQYPEEMTIVLQHQFWDMVLEEDQFTVSLNGTAMLSVQDATYDRGTIGMRVVNTHAVFSDLECSPLID